MKKVILTLVIVVFVNAIIKAQTPPTPPETPKKSTSYSITFDTDDSEQNSSVSIKRNDNLYKFTAKFHESKAGDLKNLLLEKLGKTNLTVNGDIYKWVKKRNGDKLYECKLSENSLRIYVDKEYANNQTVTMIDEFGNLLKDAISGTNSKDEARKDAEREVKRAERALAKAKRELERAKRKLDN